MDPSKLKNVVSSPQPPVPSPMTPVPSHLYPKGIYSVLAISLTTVILFYCSDCFFIPLNILTCSISIIVCVWLSGKKPGEKVFKKTEMACILAAACIALFSGTHGRMVDEYKMVFRPKMPQDKKIWLVSFDENPNINLKMVFIGKGSFRMGSPLAEEKRKEGHESVHPVTISQPFWMGETVITQAQWDAVMKQYSRKQEVPEKFRGDNHPIILVSREEAEDFCKELTGEAHKTKKLSPKFIYRLPTEAEWEYACRATSTTPFNTDHYDQETIPPTPYLDVSEANFNPLLEGSNRQLPFRAATVAVKSLPKEKPKANRWGLYDLHGNVWEWCEDWYCKEFPPDNKNPVRKKPAIARHEEDHHDCHVIRGGGWASSASECRSASRGFFSSKESREDIGFRIVLSRK